MSKDQWFYIKRWQAAREQRAEEKARRAGEASDTHDDNPTEFPEDQDDGTDRAIRRHEPDDPPPPPQSDVR